MRLSRRGFTLIELMVVVTIIGILVTIGFPRLQATKMKAIKASMISDLRNLVTAQEAFLSVYADYAGSITSGPEVPGSASSPGVLSFRLSPGNVAVLTRQNPSGGGGPGWNATITNPAIANTDFSECGVYVGAASYSPNSAITREGMPGCY